MTPLFPLILLFAGCLALGFLLGLICQWRIDYKLAWRRGYLAALKDHRNVTELRIHNLPAVPGEPD